MLNEFKYRRAVRRLVRDDRPALTQAQKAETHQAGRNQAAVLGAATTIVLGIIGALLEPVLDSVIYQGFVVGILGAATVSFYGLIHGSIYELRQQRHRLRTVKAELQELEA